MMGEYAKFLGLHFERTVRLKYGNFLVALHTRFTPNTSTGTKLNEIVLEQLRLMERINEQKQHIILDKMIEIGKEIDPNQSWLVTEENSKVNFTSKNLRKEDIRNAPN